MVQDIDIAHAIWGNKMLALNRKTTRKKSIHVAGDIIIITKEIIKILKHLFMIADIFFVNGITFFILMICNIIFTELGHIDDRESITIFKEFREMNMHYLKRGFQITTLHVDGEFKPIW